MRPKVIAILIILVLILVILFQNTRVISFHLLFWKIEMSQFILVLLTLAIGFVLGYVAAKVPRGRA